MFGKRTSVEVTRSYRHVSRPGVRFERVTVQSIDPHTKRVETDGGSFDCDILVVALGADLDPAATPGLLEGGHEFYTNRGAFAFRDCRRGGGNYRSRELGAQHRDLRRHRHLLCRVRT